MEHLRCAYALRFAIAYESVDLSIALHTRARDTAKIRILSRKSIARLIQDLRAKGATADPQKIPVDVAL